MYAVTLSRQLSTVQPSWARKYRPDGFCCAWLSASSHHIAASLRPPEKITRHWEILRRTGCDGYLSANHGSCAIDFFAAITTDLSAEPFRSAFFLLAYNGRSRNRLRIAHSLCVCGFSCGTVRKSEYGKVFGDSLQSSRPAVRWLWTNCKSVCCVLCDMRAYDPAVFDLFLNQLQL